MALTHHFEGPKHGIAKREDERRRGFIESDTVEVDEMVIANLAIHFLGSVEHTKVHAVYHQRLPQHKQPREALK